MKRVVAGGEDLGPDWQRRCIASWGAAGEWDVLSVNPEAECEVVRAAHLGLAVLPAGEEASRTYGKPCVWIEALLQAAAARPDATVVGIVNADILLDLTPAQRAALAKAAETDAIACNRLEVRHPCQREGAFYRYGYDLVLLPRAALSRIDMRGFALGLPWWDYWLVLEAMSVGLPLRVVQTEGVRHLTHEQAWDPGLWKAGLALVMRRLRERAQGSGMDGLLWRRMLDWLAAGAADEPGAPWLGPQLSQGVGMALGLEIVGMAERHAWRLT